MRCDRIQEMREMSFWGKKKLETFFASVHSAVTGVVGKQRANIAGVT